MNKVRIVVFTALLAFTTGAGALELGCLRLLPVGICVWLTCVGPYCTTSTSVKVGHFNPDLVVAIVNPQGVDRAEDAYRTDTQNRNHQNLIFREAIAIGHPLAGEIYCPSQAEKLSPYFVSTLDTLGWRWGIPDVLSPPSYVPGLREIGDWPLNTWGAVYPRTGWTIQADGPKGVAVTAQRAGDIITRSGEPHVYKELSGIPVDGQKLTWPPVIGLTENTNRGGDWQLHPPRKQDDKDAESGSVKNVLPKCEVFGENDIFTAYGWGGGKVSSNGEYLLTLWRPYTCCKIEGTIFLFSIDFVPYPPPN